MIKTKYEQGARDALVRLKLSTAGQVTGGHGPMTPSMGAPTTLSNPPTSAAPAIAAGASKAKVLG
jgi:hypothetical protein